MKIMFDMFKVKYPTTKIRYSYFVKYFHEHFDIHFGSPVDTCCKSKELDLKIKSPSLGDAAKRAAAAELAIHKRRAKKFYLSLKESTECKIRDDLVVITFDYMQNVHLLEVPVEDLFYLTQLTVIIFGIHNLKFELLLADEQDEGFSRDHVPTPLKKKPSRKRQTNFMCRKKVKVQQRRNLGFGYTTPKGVEWDPKTLGPPCACMKKCREALEGEERNIFNSFWDLKTYEKQNA
ncbi:unnamed protein product [Psylliodes chrysocephalus]|uniref:Uncharacterized protein n=1 Tax=Psylliodes chrysocephalus TaxID=3402493 RepID=A0A9P0CPB9_9CUCU|nr:unnamed protein product [Psylliodes chrysocephala]